MGNLWHGNGPKHCIGQKLWAWSKCFSNFKVGFVKQKENITNLNWAISSHVVNRGNPFKEKFIEAYTKLKGRSASGLRDRYRKYLKNLT